ncbi:MAG: response regulator [Deltaproteobacteria bacterium]|nr:response regulator [Deltaproteobacteria bacterium]
MRGKILIVDDELDILELLEMIIAERTSHQVVTTNNPLEVPPLLKHDPFDLLITDLRMPGLSGMDLIREAKTIDPDMPVIVITAYGSSQSAEEAIAEGAYDYITKPFRKDQIIITINRAMEWHAMKKELAALRAQHRPDSR